MKNLKIKMLLVVAGATLFSNSIFAREKFAPLTINASVQHVSCFGMNDGRIEIEISGGKAPYIIAWDNGNETTIMEGLRDGEYSVKICDAKGKEAVEYFCIDTPDKLKIKEISNSLNDNFETPIEITGGSPWLIDDELKYRLSYFEIQPSAAKANNNPTGIENYLIRIMDYNGCAVEERITDEELNSMLLSNKQLFLESESPNPEELGETTPTTTSANMNDFAGNDPVLPGQPLIQQ